MGFEQSDYQETDAHEKVIGEIKLSKQYTKLDLSKYYPKDDDAGDFALERMLGNIVIPQNGLLRGLDTQNTKVAIPGTTAQHYLEKKEDLYIYNVKGTFATTTEGNVTDENMISTLTEARVNELLASNTVTSFDFIVSSGISAGKYVQRIEIKFKIDEPGKQRISSVTMKSIVATRDKAHNQQNRDKNFINTTSIPSSYYIKTSTTDTPEQKIATKVGVMLTRTTQPITETNQPIHATKETVYKKGLTLNTTETKKFPDGVTYFNISGLPTSVTGILQGNSHTEAIPKPTMATYKRLDQSKTKTALIHYKRPADTKYFQQEGAHYKLNFTQVRNSFPKTADIFAGPMSRKDMKTDDWRNIKGKCFINGQEESPTGRNEDTGTPVSGVETRQNSAIVLIKNGIQELTHYQEILTSYGTIEKFEHAIKTNKRTVYQAPSVYRAGTYNPSLSDDTASFHRYLIEEPDGTTGVIELDFGSNSVSSRGAAQAINQVFPTKRIVYLDTGAVQESSPANNPKNISANTGYIGGVVITGR